MRNVRTIARVLIIAGAAAYAFAGCAPKAPETAPADRGVAPTWKGDIRPVVESWCRPCHFPGGAAFPKAPFDSYEGLAGRAAKVRELVFVTKAMPIGKQMPDDLRALIARWVEAGAPR